MSSVARALLLTVLALAVLLGAVWLLSGKTKGLKRPSMEFIEHYWAPGPYAGEDSLATNLRGGSALELFEKRRDYAQRVMGAYEGHVADLLEEVDPTGKNGEYVAKLRFENGEAMFRIALRKQGDGWKVRSARTEIEQPEPSNPAYRDPKDAAVKLLRAWGRGYTAMVREQFTRELALRLPASSFKERSTSFFEPFGDFEEADVTGSEDLDGGGVRIAVRLTFTSDTVPATIDLVWRGLRWYIQAIDAEGFE
ncbi:MAG: hypothetical protein QNJ90_10025 [Planctomycetota bacterium]|nr:hypothetical protein [Planctomycetota bacterium]